MIFRKSLIFVFAGFILCLVPLMLPSCTHDPVGIELLDTVCFGPTVMGIIQGCGSNGTIKCHDGSTEPFSIYDTASIMRLVNTPGDPKGCKLYQVITDINGENFMPPGHALSREDRTLIAVWIAQGASQKECGPVPVDAGGGGGTLKDCSDSVYFAQKILPLFSTRCVSCHDGSPHGDEDNLFKLDSYQAIKNHINLSDPASSDVYKVLGKSGDDLMPPPPNEPLKTDDKAMLLKWITEGARNNSCSGGICDTSAVITYTGQIDNIIQQNCMPCHLTATTTNTGVDLSSPGKVIILAQTLRPAGTGTPVLIGAINRMQNFKAMPKAVALDPCSIRTIELWIRQGMQ